MFDSKENYKFDLRVEALKCMLSKKHEMILIICGEHGPVLTENLIQRNNLI